MEQERVSRIDLFLTKRGASYCGLSDRQKSQLHAVDDAIQTRIRRIKDAEKVIREQAINVQNIATDSGLARKTFYNNELLRLFVEEYSSEANDSITKSKEEIKHLIEEINQLKNERQKMVDRDREVELNRLELSTMQRELKILRKENEELQRKNAELLNAKESKTSNGRCKVLYPKDGDIGSLFKRH